MDIIFQSLNRINALTHLSADNVEDMGDWQYRM